jgi:hypothetical protein
MTPPQATHSLYSLSLAPPPALPTPLPTLRRAQNLALTIAALCRASLRASDGAAETQVFSCHENRWKAIDSGSQLLAEMSGLGFVVEPVPAAELAAALAHCAHERNAGTEGIQLARMRLGREGEDVPLFAVAAAAPAAGGGGGGGGSRGSGGNGRGGSKNDRASASASASDIASDSDSESESDSDSDDGERPALSAAALAALREVAGERGLLKAGTGGGGGGSGSDTDTGDDICGLFRAQVPTPVHHSVYYYNLA